MGAQGHILAWPLVRNVLGKVRSVLYHAVPLFRALAIEWWEESWAGSQDVASNPSPSTAALVTLPPLLELQFVSL